MAFCLEQEGLLTDREVGLAYMKSFEIEKRIRTKGKAEGKAEDILVLLSAKGAIPPEVKETIDAQMDMDVLNRWLLLAAETANVEEFSQRMHSARSGH